MTTKATLLLGTLGLSLLGPACSDETEQGLPYSGPVAAGAGTGGAFATAGAGGGSAGSTSGAATTAGGGGTLPGAAGMAGGAGLGGAAGSAGVAGSGGSGVPVSAAQATYDMNCQLCHGDKGAGTQLGPEIEHPVTDYATWVVRNGRAQTTFLKPMEKLGSDVLSDEQLTLILGYLAEPPKPTTGQALYQDFCGNCHGMDARGGPVDRDILNEVDKIDELVRNGKSKGQYQMRHDSMPSFSTTLLSDAELKSIRDYVDSL